MAAYFINLREAPGGFEPPNEGFADPCLTTWRRRQISRQRVSKPKQESRAYFVVPLLGLSNTRGGHYKDIGMPVNEALRVLAWLS